MPSVIENYVQHPACRRIISHSTARPVVENFHSAKLEEELDRCLRHPDGLDWLRRYFKRQHRLELLTGPELREQKQEARFRGRQDALGGTVAVPASTTSSQLPRGTAPVPAHSSAQRGTDSVPTTLQSVITAPAPPRQDPLRGTAPVLAPPKPAVSSVVLLPEDPLCGAVPAATHQSAQRGAGPARPAPESVTLPVHGAEPAHVPPATGQLAAHITAALPTPSSTTVGAPGSVPATSAAPGAPRPAKDANRRKPTAGGSARTRPYSAKKDVKTKAAASSGKSKDCKRELPDLATTPLREDIKRKKFRDTEPVS